MGSGFSEASIAAIWQVLASILKIGNLKFMPEDPSAQLKKTSVPGISKVAPEEQHLIKSISELLGVTIKELTDHLVLGKSLDCAKTGEPGPCSQADCYLNRDRFAQFLYEQLFSWILEHLNRGLRFRSEREGSSDASNIYIGLLDMFGFENYGSNTFEQFCINYADECLLGIY